ncbi:MAG: ubiquinol-cytochrome c reductase iron-sulfur subunit [Pseudomonadota bacterium]
MSDGQATGGHGEDGVGRRDFLFIATGAAGAVAVGGIAWPLIASLGPNEAVKAAGAPTEIDISAIEEGQQIVVIWREAPYFIRKLSDEEAQLAIDAEQTVFRDYAPAAERIASAEGSDTKWTIIAANCTHLGCVPTKVDEGLDGWVCPCHGSKFDVTGRVTKGPAPVNLPLPPYVFSDEDTLVIGSEQA